MDWAAKDRLRAWGSEAYHKVGRNSPEFSRMLDLNEQLRGALDDNDEHTARQIVGRMDAIANRQRPEVAHLVESKPSPGLAAAIEAKRKAFWDSPAGQEEFARMRADQERYLSREELAQMRARQARYPRD